MENGSAIVLLFCSAERKDMGEPNNALKVYMNRPDRIRSVLEYYLGEKLPEDWSCEETGGFTTVRNADGKISFRERDYLGKACAWGVCFKLGLENQNSANLTYPWRLMELDCLSYGSEIEDIQQRNMASGIEYGTEDDFKYRYKKNDYLEPILNLTLYWGRKKWKSPLSLRGMMRSVDALPDKIRHLVGDYSVHIISMRFISDEDLQKMDSDLKYVLGIMKHTASRKQYVRYIYENQEYFSRIPRSAVDVIDACTNIKNIKGILQYTLNPESGEEETDMCKALEQIERHAMKKGVKQGERRGERRGTLMTLFSLVNDGLLKLGEAARRAGLSESAFCSEMRRAGYHIN